MAQKCFPFNEFGPSVLKETSAFLQSSTCVHGRPAPRHRCFLDGAIPGGLQGLSPVSKRPRMADSTPNDRRIAAAERLEVKHHRLASSCWPLTALRLRWNPLDQHGLTVVTLLGYEPHFLLATYPVSSPNHTCERPLLHIPFHKYEYDIEPVNAIMRCDPSETSFS